MVCDSDEIALLDLAYPSLNPYSIGIWSATDTEEEEEDMIGGLNPYSIGIWSATELIATLKGEW